MSFAPPTPDDIKEYHFMSMGHEEAPHLLVLGAIHGNEKAGPLGIQRVMYAIGMNQIRLNKGQVTFIPVCNPKAYQQNIRHTGTDLNRVFRHHDSPQAYEEFLANILTEKFQGKGYLLDLHTCTAESQPFVLEEYNDQGYHEMAMAQGIETVVTGWAELDRGDRATSFYDTTKYAHELKMVGLTVECGQHDDPQAPDVAYHAIIRTLAHLGMIDAEGIEQIQPTVIHMYQVVYREHEGGSFACHWKNFDTIKKGDVVAQLPDGMSIKAEEDSRIIMPSPNAKRGGEWFYLGRVLQETCR